MPSSQSLRRRVVIGGGDDRRGAPGLAAGEAQALVRLRARHLVHEVAIDVEQRRAVRLGADDVAVPQLVVERARLHRRRPRRGWLRRRQVEKRDYCTAAIALSGAETVPRAHRNAATCGGEVGRRRARTLAAGVARSHVNWRFASWRVAAMRGRAQRRGVDVAVQKLPRLPVADAAHRRHVGRRAHGARATPRARRRGPRRASRRSARRSRRAARARSAGTSAMRDRRARHAAGFARALQLRQRPARRSRRLRARAGCAARRCGCEPRRR